MLEHVGVDRNSLTSYQELPHWRLMVVFFAVKEQCYGSGALRAPILELNCRVLQEPRGGAWGDHGKFLLAHVGRGYFLRLPGDLTASARGFTPSPSALPLRLRRLVRGLYGLHLRGGRCRNGSLTGA